MARTRPRAHFAYRPMLGSRRPWLRGKPLYAFMALYRSNSLIEGQPLTVDILTSRHTDRVPDPPIQVGQRVANAVRQIKFCVNLAASNQSSPTP